MRAVDRSPPTLADRIDAVLPQTQCTRCGYAACRPYADAVAEGSADINRCPPGGESVIVALAGLTGRTVKRLDAECGEHGPLLVAIIDEATCIGCTLCIDACPVDAILGAPKRMHTVLPSLLHRLRAVRGALPGRLHRVAARRSWLDPGRRGLGARTIRRSRAAACTQRTRRKTHGGRGHQRRA